MAEQRAAEEILDDIDDASGDSGKTEVGELKDSFGNRGAAAFLIVPALIGISPVAGIPSVPTIIAAVILLFAVQIAMGRDGYWMPGFLEKRKISGDKLSGFADKMRGVAHWIDEHMGNRLTVLSGPTATRVAGGAVVLLCLAVPPLEFLPFAAALPFAAIALIGLALLLKDGLVMLLAMVATVGAVVGGLWMWLGG
ncbi:exopolysaccharide biosynthesis protein [Wenxinia marina]|uniref:Putative ABC-type transport system, permease component n=1 Tax=Wenxinia marina DSM 24838 TaxID=1123501 RepID=A0A0D0Q2G3_9RHOB|nr:exopolysaccharide biosynthesis protein [Wenxinia marina]KIQ68694.1 putative ABC-type transport system, permease component [Wenxinia marina DSM 24838]GGL67979.1 hypothetical protein GCM10011392_23080 [Wenxinia marina]